MRANRLTILQTRPQHGNKERKEGGEMGADHVHHNSDIDDEEQRQTRGEYAARLTFCNPGRLNRPVILQQVLMSSVQMLGEGSLGISHKVVLPDSPVLCAKRFRLVLVTKKEFGRCMERLANVGRRCNHLVPLQAFVYAKRIKVVLCNYYPMGSLADLLTGARKMGYTPLDWRMRHTIIVNVAAAIAYIHMQQPTSHEKTQLRLNIHGNIKASNVFITTNFSAHLSDYGFAQLCHRAEYDTASPSTKPLQTAIFDASPTQAGDVHNFGIIMLDVLGGPVAPQQIEQIHENWDGIKEGALKFFEFPAEGQVRRHAFRTLEIAFACINSRPDARPTIGHILRELKEVSIQ